MMKSKMTLVMIMGCVLFALASHGGPPPVGDYEMYQECIVRPTACPASSPQAVCNLGVQDGASCFVCTMPRLYEKCALNLLESCLEWQQPASVDCGLKYWGNCNAGLNICFWTPGGTERCARFNCYTAE